jgi:peptide/nickel transport system substrate-binding protein
VDAELVVQVARTLYGYNLSGPPEQVTDPVPDIASGPPQLSADRRTYTFSLRAGVRYAPPVNREVTARDFITAIQRLYDKTTPSEGRVYAGIIAGAAAFGAGKAGRISGLAAPDAHTLQITLVQPAGDFLSILAIAYFAPVPGEYAAGYAVGANYSGHVVGSGPYTLDVFIPGETVVLVRNANWDPASDPLRRAWVDRIQVKTNVGIPSIQRAIDCEEADLSLDSHVPQTRVAALRTDPERSRRLSVKPTGSLLLLAPGTHRAAGAIADVRVRQAVNYAIDRAAYRDAIAERFAPAGEVASTILAPGSLGYHHYDLYPTPGGRDDPAKARALLAEAGYPHGVTLGFVTFGSGNFSEYDNPVVNRLIDRALAEPDPDHRAAMWGEIDQQIMRDAPLVPLVWESFAFQWASRVHGWRYDPGRSDPTSPPRGWTPPAPDRPSAQGRPGPGRRGDRGCPEGHHAPSRGHMACAARPGFRASGLYSQGWPPGGDPLPHDHRCLTLRAGAS